MKRALLILLLLGPLVAQVQDPAQAVLQVRCLSVAEGRQALTEGLEAAYFESVQLGDLRAKTGLPLTGLPLVQAREQARRHYAAQVQAFTAEEEAMIRGVLERAATRVAERVPLMARTPFSFIKAGMGVEGGLPHTRGSHILLSPMVLTPLVGLHKQKAFAQLDRFGASLFIHEQTHVLQRQHPEIFQSLYTDTFGFVHLAVLPDHPWLAERRVVNPDGPDLRWAFRVQGQGSIRWIRPDLALRTLDRPRMPQDFQMIAVALEEDHGAWRVALDERGQPRIEDLGRIGAYVAAFPNPDEFYHPHEIVADLLATWVTGFVDRQPDHPLRSRTAAWAREHLN
jgi:hypothetical protein